MGWGNWVAATLWLLGGVVWYLNALLYGNSGSPIYLKVSMGSMFVCIGCLYIVLAVGGN